MLDIGGIFRCLRGSLTDSLDSLLGISFSAAETEREGDRCHPMSSSLCCATLSKWETCTSGAIHLWVMVLLGWLRRHLFPLQPPHNAPYFHITISYHASISRQVSHKAFFSHSKLPVPSSSFHSAMKGSKLLFKQVWPHALLSSGQLFRRHLMLNMELLTEMSYSLLGSWQTAGVSQEEQKRFIGEKVFYYRQGKKQECGS